MSINLLRTEFISPINGGYLKLLVSMAFLLGFQNVKAQDCNVDSVFFNQSTLKGILKKCNLEEKGVVRFRVAKDDKGLNVIGVYLFLESHEESIFLKIEPVKVTSNLTTQVGACKDLHDLPKIILRRKILQQLYCDSPWN
ncbi:MAG: hypothetical protein RL204_129 [Bacteroidota bacterium]